MRSSQITLFNKHLHSILVRFRVKQLIPVIDRQRYLHSILVRFRDSHNGDRDPHRQFTFHSGKIPGNATLLMISLLKNLHSILVRFRALLSG